MRLVAAALLLSVVLACDSRATRAFPEAEDRFARAYIRTLHDSGVGAVLGRTKRETVAVPAFALGVEAMRHLLPDAAIDTVQLETYEALADSAGGRAMRLVYGVRGGGEAARVEMRVEREGDRPVVEEIKVARREP